MRKGLRQQAMRNPNQRPALCEMGWVSHKWRYRRAGYWRDVARCGCRKIDLTVSDLRIGDRCERCGKMFRAIPRTVRVCIRCGLQS